MNKRERIFATLKGTAVDRLPTGFWMHFPETAFFGETAVKTHLDYFKQTKTDICKIMTEYTYPYDGNINKATDWNFVKSYSKNEEFIQKQAEIVRAVTAKCEDAATVATIHGIVASASHTLLGVPRYDSIGRFAQLYHLRTNPNAISDAYQHIAQTLCVMVHETIKAGADGIYYAALGGERDGYTDEEHERFIAPLDKLVLSEAYRAGAKFVILHMCKPKVNLARFVNYPCDIVNWGIRESGITLEQGKKIFKNKVVLGGLDNQKGPLLHSGYTALENAVHQLINQVGADKLILGSDCTLPGDIPYERIANVARACESYQQQQGKAINE